MSVLSIDLRKSILSIPMELSISILSFYIFLAYSLKLTILLDNYDNVGRVFLSGIVLFFFLVIGFYFLRTAIKNIRKNLHTIKVYVEFSNGMIFIYESIDDNKKMINHFDMTNLVKYDFEEIPFKKSHFMQEYQSKLVINGVTESGEEIHSIIFDSTALHGFIYENDISLIQTFLETELTQYTMLSKRNV